MDLATFIEMSISEFWEITPFELNRAAKGYVKRQKLRQKESIFQAYLISRWVWQKRIDIKKILDDKKPKKVMTDEEMLAQVKALNAAFGGEVVRR